MPDVNPLLVVGSVALDTIETPSGRRNAILGGSAVHFSLAARHFAPVSVVGIVGRDFPDEHVQFLAARGIDLTGLTRADGRTFRWHGRYEGSMNSATTLATELNVFGEFRPDVPGPLRGARYVLLGNSSPRTQAHLLSQLTKPAFVMLDSMDLWIRNERHALEEMMPRVTAISLNADEARMLADEPLLYRAVKRLAQMGPKAVVVKSAEYGATLATREFLCSLPTYPTTEVVDPTGAGDAFAGGFLGYLASKDRVDEGTLRAALAHGAVMGSLAVEAFGAERLAHATRREIDQRVNELLDLVRVDGFGK